MTNPTKQITTHSTGLCRYLQHEDDVHHFLVVRSSTPAVDALFEMMGQIYDAHISANAPLVRVMLDVRVSGMLPPAYTIIKLRQWMIEHPAQHKTCVAILYGEDWRLHTAQALINMLRLTREEFRFFGAAEYQCALDWLRDGRVVTG